jgi:hypothetical protein
MSGICYGYESMGLVLVYLFFGSARTKPDDQYLLAEKLLIKLVKVVAGYYRWWTRNYGSW